MTDIQKGDKGTQLRVQIFEGTSPVNVAAATGITIHLKAPSGTVTSKTGSIITGASGIVGYTTTTTNDISEVGNWKIQGKLTISSWTGHTSQSNFTVYDNLA